ncbi:hypothetical protein HD554DRAFT_1979211, partial [Boletus coccyginus]
IWQQNFNKSNAAQQHFLSNLNPNSFNIATIQELIINCVNLIIFNPRWNIIYLTTHGSEDAPYMRSIILINKNL